MERDNGNTDDTRVVGLDSVGSLRIDCYIRSNISRISERQVEVLLDRLESLREAGLVADYQTTQWPPERHSPVESQASETTRGELFTKFETWAEGRGYSLSPAFERRTIHTSLLGSDEPYEKVRVPIVTLALYDEYDDETPLTGVVPYTDQPETDESQTHTIDDWLRVVETRAERLPEIPQPQPSVSSGN